MVHTSLADKSRISPYRSVFESAFFGNNVKKIESVTEAYFLAKSSPGTIVTDIPIYRPEYHGLPYGSTVLVFNEGGVVGRCAQARRIAYTPGIDVKKYGEILREAVYQTRGKQMYHAQALIGLHEDFMVKANLLMPQGFENQMLSWLLNFQWFETRFREMYERSRMLNDFEILVVADPYWQHPDFPLGLSFFDSEHNCAGIFGMRYFGEFKKGTLTLAWGTANRNGYASCHGGLKRYDDYNKVFAFFGLSGSGKSTLTHAKHDGKYKITILHDDAFIINTENYSSIALEPSYFDKTADYKIGDPDNKYILTAQNIGVSVDEQTSKLVLVTEDIRNDNGRAVKSDLWSPNRVDKIDDPISSVFWLMKDPSLPPVVKIDSPVLASTLGATLATKRTSAERVVNVDLDKLVVEPYANPFRTYPLREDYLKFKSLFERGVSCYILNTGSFITKKVPKEITLDILERLVENRAEFVKFTGIEELSYMPIDGFNPNMTDVAYCKFLRERFADRLDFISSRDEATKGFDVLPTESLDSIKKLLDELDAQQ